MFVSLDFITEPCRLFTVRDKRVEEGILVRKYHWLGIDIPAIILERSKHDLWIVRVDLRDSFALWRAHGHVRINTGYIPYYGQEFMIIREDSYPVTDAAIVLYEDTQSLALVVNFSEQESIK